MARRLKAMGRPEYQNVINERGWTGKINLLPERLETLKHKKRRRKIFVNSMSDLLHPSVPQMFINQVVAAMSNAPQHTYQILTKRYSRASLSFYPQDAVDNIWIGFSISDQKTADEARIELRYVHDMGWRTWVSYEPALEDVKWSGWEFIDWMVVGGESGPQCRPFDWDWARHTLFWTNQNNIATWIKQGGGHPDRRERLEDLPKDLRVRRFPVFCL